MTKDKNNSVRLYEHIGRGRLLSMDNKMTLMKTVFIPILTIASLAWGFAYKYSTVVTYCRVEKT